MDLDSALTGKPVEGVTATEILRADHREVRRLFDEFESVRADRHAAKVVAQALSLQLELHAAIEHDVFYPAASEVDPERVEHANRMHEAVAAAAKRVRDDADADRPLDAPIAELKALVEPHVLEEEQRLFPRIEKRPETWQRELGAAIIKRKEELTGSADSLENPAT